MILCVFAIQSNIDFVIDNKMNAALIHNVSQDNKEKYCQGKGKEFDTITWLGLIWTTKTKTRFQGMEWDDKWNWKFDNDSENKFQRKSQYDIKMQSEKRILHEKVFQSRWNYITT